MDSSCISCLTLACPDKGRVDAGTIHVHFHTEQRYRCRTYGRILAAGTNTPLYLLHHPEATMTVVLTQLHDCSILAVVAAFAGTNAW